MNVRNAGLSCDIVHFILLFRQPLGYSNIFIMAFFPSLPMCKQSTAGKQSFEFINWGTCVYEILEGNGKN